MRKVAATIQQPDARAERFWRLFNLVSIAFAILLILFVTLGYMGLFDEPTRDIFRYAVVVQIIFIVTSGVRALSLLWRKRNDVVGAQASEISITVFHYIALSVVLNLNSRELGLLRDPVLKTGKEKPGETRPALQVDIKQNKATRAADQINQ